MAVVRHQAVGTARSMSRLARTTAFSKAQAPAGSPSARSRPASNSAASPIHDSRTMTSLLLGEGERASRMTRQLEVRLGTFRTRTQE